MHLSLSKLDCEPNHIISVLLQSLQCTPLGNIQHMAGQVVSETLGFQKCAAIVELYVICVHVQMDCMLIGHSSEVFSVSDKTRRSKNSPLWHTACDRKVVYGNTGIDKWLSWLAEIGLEPVECSATNAEAIRQQHTQQDLEVHHVKCCTAGWETRQSSTDLHDHCAVHRDGCWVWFIGDVALSSRNLQLLFLLCQQQMTVLVVNDHSTD